MAIGERKPTMRDIAAFKTKKKIFDTAITLFTQHGFEKTTVDDITKFAGVSKGNFYTHFPSKESVLVEQFRQIDNFYAAALKTIDSTMSASDYLILFFDTMCDYCMNVCGVNVMKVVYMNQIGLGEKKRILIDSENREIYAKLRSIVDYGIESGSFKTKMDREALVELLASMARGLIFNWCLFDGDKDLKAMAKPLTNVIIEWLSSEHSVPPVLAGQSL